MPFKTPGQISVGLGGRTCRWVAVAAAGILLVAGACKGLADLGNRASLTAAA